jgi:hypothetical protein
VGERSRERQWKRHRRVNPVVIRETRVAPPLH